MKNNPGTPDFGPCRNTAGSGSGAGRGFDWTQQSRWAGNRTGASMGGAAGGSKILYTVGPAVIQAVESARKQLLQIAAEQLEAAVEDLEIMDDKVRVKGAPGQEKPIAELARMTMQFGGRYAPVYGSGTTAQTNRAPGAAAHLVRVHADPELVQARRHQLLGEAAVEREGIRVEQHPCPPAVGLGHHARKIPGQQRFAEAVEDHPLHARELVQHPLEAFHVEVGLGLPTVEGSRAGLAQLVAPVGRLDVDLARGRRRLHQARSARLGRSAGPPKALRQRGLPRPIRPSRPQTAPARMNTRQSSGTHSTAYS